MLPLNEEICQYSQQKFYCLCRENQPDRMHGHLEKVSSRLDHQILEQEVRHLDLKVDCHLDHKVCLQPINNTSKKKKNKLPLING